jgi:uncharacterized protein (DUF1778 family)
MVIYLYLIFRAAAMSVQNLPGSTRDVTINIRANQVQRDLIDHAAEIQGKSRSEFMLQSAYQKAQDVLLDRCFFGLDAAKFAEFMALLDAPTGPNPQLQTLLATPPPWN